MALRKVCSEQLLVSCELRRFLEAHQHDEESFYLSTHSLQCIEQLGLEIRRLYRESIKHQNDEKYDSEDWTLKWPPQNGFQGTTSSLPYDAINTTGTSKGWGWEHFT